MKAKFELKDWMTENREQVIESYNSLTKEGLFNGISLKSYMVEVFNAMIRNNIKSKKRAASMLPFLMGDVYFDNSKVGATVYSTPYSESNHAKRVNYYGKEKANQLNNL